MSGRRRRTPGAAGWVLVMTLLLTSGRCEDPRHDAGAEHAVQALLDRRAAAVLAGDRAAFLDTVDPRSGDYRRQQRTVVANLARLRPAAWTYDLHRLTGDDRRTEADGEVEAEVGLRYRLTRNTRSSVRATERFTLRHRDGRWHLTGEAPGGARQLWEQGPVRVLRGEHSLVLGTVDRRTLRGVAQRAERAVPAVSRHWPRPWPGRTVVLVPGSVPDMAELLDGDASTYQGIAAVTTGGPHGGGSGEWQRIVVNRQAFGLLSDRGRQVVMTHETAHVATRTDTGEATPLWLSEGLADWLGYRGTGIDPAEAAPALTRAVRAGNVPGRLPPDRQFGFTSDPDALARAYEGAWFACRTVADRWGAARLAELYVAVGRSDAPPEEAVDGALRAVLGVSTADFTRTWRSALRAQLGGS